ncbi:MAG: hypothetical protein NTV52_16460 [Acidobacteria bacterium]|nr:hypothetical protein [Acidobacteriota bacterium]
MISRPLQNIFPFGSQSKAKRIALTLAFLVATLITTYFLLASFGLGFLAGQIRQRLPQKSFSPADHVATVGFNIYLAPIAFQATFATFLLRAPGRWRFTTVLASFTLHIILAFITSLAAAWVLLELTQTFRPLGIPVELATNLVRHVANHKASQ